MTTLNLNAHEPVVDALHHLIDQFGSEQVWAKEDGSRGLFVKVDGLKLCDAFVQSETWCGFQISMLFPAADIYPHHVRCDLARRSGKPFEPPFNCGQTFPGTQEASIMISRSVGNHQIGSYLGPELAYLKLRKVLRWLNENG